jgi:protein tyrosine phosphatase (PTP) superfamily phosphohydrolase (DUF442 family)
MISSTHKTVFGYFMSRLRKYLPWSSSGKAVSDIYNYLKISDILCTSGQPTARQFVRIRDAGYSTVINLAPHSAENAIADEAACVTDLGMTYVHIPVDFKNPTQQDFATFVDAMKQHTHEKVWVHCAANMRVSAFVYRYRVEVDVSPDLSSTTI